MYEIDVYLVDLATGFLTQILLITLVDVSVYEIDVHLVDLATKETDFLTLAEK